MSVPPRGQYNTTAHIPPIEIGSFVALPSSDSEFIGSASGVFFADTVFRAFARVTAVERPDASSDGPDPGSAHTYLVAPETHDGNEPVDDRHAGASASIASPDTRSYGIDTVALGVAPPPDIAQKLLETFFQHWHPFFPFLHGPTFLEQVDRFYDEKPASGPATEPKSTWRLCRAVTFQCIFNIAASTSGHVLDPACRIQPNPTFTSIIGPLLSNHDVASLQALLAAELYLITRMSLRAASTIQGALARSIYNSGFHRCPSRYLQLPPGTSGIRKRIFWCAYVLDRYVGQALGHPFSIQDADIDVCIPGMIELHRPVNAREPVAASQSALNQQVLNHLPMNHVESGYSSGNPSSQPGPGKAVLTAYDSLSAQSPAQHYTAAGKQARELILSHLATYSRLLGEVVHLFHRSIHSRNINPESIREITYRVHCWWNGLPPAFQDESPDHQSSHSVFFNMLHNYLILLVHRPFLSLPPDRQDFQSSVQVALSASRSIIVKLQRRTDDPFLMAWPATLSAVWMAGLVIAFASLLELYPNAKANSDLSHCLAVLETMASRWTSARHCHGALRSLLQRLNTRFGPGPADFGLAVFPPRVSGRFLTQPTDLESSQAEGRGTKRQRQYDSRPRPSQNMAQNSTVDAGLFPGEDWMPVMEYTGPDFGFDTAHIDSQDLFGGAQDGEMGSLFNNMGWDSNFQGSGNFGA